MPFADKRPIHMMLMLMCLAVSVSVTQPAVLAAEAIIADHLCTDIAAIPQAAIEQAKADLHIAYGHTSHGSQLTTGMSGLVAFANGGGLGLALPIDIFDWNNGGTGGALDLHDYAMGGDVGYYPQWVNNTRSYLDDPTHADVNVIIWSWCGQVDDKYSAGTLESEYIIPMTQLEADYPGVTFVYMTGHVDIWDDADNKAANQTIRDYCTANGKVLYDFADIEHYDPDGTYFEYVHDNCNYYDGPGGTVLGNWATEWQSSHIEGDDWYNCSSAHSQPLNANRKAYAAWWLWARLAGWGACAQVPTDLSATADSDLGQVTLTWSDQSDNEDGFVIQRQVDGGDWEMDYATVAADMTTFMDSGLAPGDYQYRVLAYRSDDGSGVPCTSGASNTVQVEIVNTDLPAAPTDLMANADSVAGSVTLSWTDNADNEDAFRIQRQVDGGAWDDNHASVAANTTTYMDSGLGSGNYNYRVVATNAHGDSNPSNTASAAIVQSVPMAPTNLTATVSGFDIVLTWTDESDNESAFVVDRAVDSGGFSLLVGDLAANAQTFTDGDLLPLHTYTYRVKAVNSFGDSAWSGEASQYLYEATMTVTLNNDDAGEIIDAFLREDAPDTNYGDTSYATTYDRFVVQFNLPAEVMGKRIISAEMSYYVWAVDGADAGTLLDIYPVTQAWEEGTVTWESASAGVPWGASGGDIGAPVAQTAVEAIDHAFLTPVDITDTVQQWVDGSLPNYGLILHKGPDVGMGVKASEYSLAASPYLTITYTSKICTDMDTDGDVDGADLAELIAADEMSCLETFAGAFGR